AGAGPRVSRPYEPPRPRNSARHAGARCVSPFGGLQGPRGVNAGSARRPASPQPLAAIPPLTFTAARRGSRRAPGGGAHLQENKTNSICCITIRARPFGYYGAGERRCIRPPSRNAACGTPMAAAAAASALTSKQPRLAPAAQAKAGRFWPLTIGAIGVVYGDIGTSPIYAFREAAVAATGDAQVGDAIVLGILSLIVWSLLLLVTVKYVFLLLRADFNGEGGTFALMALAQAVTRRAKPAVFVLGITGAAFLYGDAAITPALSVISAVEGLKVIAPAFDKAVVPLSIAILIALFAVQSRGTGKVGALFGPIILVWFAVLGAVGLVHIAANPQVLAAFNPAYGIDFLLHSGLVGFAVLGLVFLAVTGSETLYADLGHFGRLPIQTAWLCVALPALTINYLGQGALVLGNPAAIDNPFFLMFPEWALIPAVLLATAATVIASQAVITGAYSLTRQAIQLGFLPRFNIRHTSEAMSGQIYLPRVNWLLLGVVLVLVVVFKSSSALASAYGVAVTATMITTSMMAFLVVRRGWLWPAWRVAALMVPLAAIEIIFFAANIIKFLE